MSPLNELSKGRLFNNYEEIQDLVGKLKNESFIALRIQDSETIKQYNKKIKTGSLKQQNERWKFKYVKFVCSHYGKPRNRSKGSRPNQKVFSCECPFFFRVLFDVYLQKFKVSSLCLEHITKTILFRLKVLRITTEKSKFNF